MINSELNPSNVFVSLKNESCFDFLKTVKSNSVSLVLIDPPYEVSRETNFQSGDAKGKDTDRFRVSMDFGMWDYGFTGLSEVISECYRVLKKSGTLICFYDIWKITVLREYFDNAKFKQLRFIEWLKTNPVPLNSKVNYLTNSREIALVGVKGGKPTFHSEYDNGIYPYPICHDKGRFHPTQKPLALFEDLIVKHSNEGDLVLDCFSGSGTTALAAYNTNRSFIGCELSKEYYRKSVERLAESSIEITERCAKCGVA
ncbi:MAG: site-specific DNA-methyltransferase [Clostridiales bacterium]|nr:site-specific DNA-methyltransferase [Clostridiales bacterium]